MNQPLDLSHENRVNNLSQNSISVWWERWFLSCNAKDIGTLYLIFALFSGLLGTAYSVLIRLELSGPGVQYIADNQLYNSIITAHAILMIFFMVIPAMIGGFGNFLLPLFSGGPTLVLPKFNFNYCFKLILNSFKFRLLILCLIYSLDYWDLLNIFKFNILMVGLLINLYIYKAFNRSSCTTLPQYFLNLAYSLIFIRLFWTVLSELFLPLSTLFALLVDGSNILLAEGSGDSPGDGAPQNGGAGPQNEGEPGPQNEGEPGPQNDEASHSTASSTRSEDDESESISEAQPDIMSVEDQRIADCEHPALEPFSDQSQDGVDNQLCDLNQNRLPNGQFEKHPAYVGGLSPTQCPSCFGVFCRDCLEPDYDTDASLSSSPNHSGDEDDDLDWP